MSEVLSTETKFTSGTWHASATFRKEGSSPGIDIGSSNGTNLATVYYEKLDQEPREVRANANLFAASKDLYEALKLALAAWGLEKSEPGFSLSAIEKQMRAALLKAHGGSSNEGE